MKNIAFAVLILTVSLLPNSALAQGGVNPPPITPTPPPPTGTVVPPGDPNTPNVTRLPHDFPYGMLPWYGVFDPKKVNTGTLVRYIEVPPQQVVVDVYVPGPGSFSGGFEPQLFEIPGFVITETTTGYIYPARVGLREITRGVFNWVTEPQGFQPK